MDGKSNAEKILKSLGAANLVAVSKTQSADAVRTAYGWGLREFGENYVQEFLEKHEALNDLPIRWHFIGHLQTNKVKAIVGKVELIHSVDSVRLAKEIAKRAAEKSVRQKILLQMNLAAEETKGGLSEGELIPALKELADLPGLKICGLMTIPPPVENPEDSRPIFRKMKALLDASTARFSQCPLKELSMGMTQDYSVAIEEGATLVRIGTAIFGRRQ